MRNIGQIWSNNLLSAAQYIYRNERTYVQPYSVAMIAYSLRRQTFDHLVHYGNEPFDVVSKLP